MARKEVEYPSHQKFIKVKWTSESEEVHYSIFCDDLPEDMIQNAMREVNETQDSRTQGIWSLNEFMRTRKEVEYSSHQKFIKVKWTSGWEEVHYSIFCDDLPEDMIQNAMREVNETQESRTEGMRSLKEFMRKKKLSCSDDEILIAVLRNCKYDIKKSESKLEKYLNFREGVGKKIADTDINNLEAGMDLMAIGILPYRDSHGRIMWFTRPVEEMTTYETDLILLYLHTFILFILSLPMTSLFGKIYIAGSGFPSVQTGYSTLKLFRHFLPTLINIPIRIRKVAIVNEHFLIRGIYNVLRPLVPPKIANRVSFLGEGYENLSKHYHPDILPKEFRGNLGPLSDQYYRKKFLDFAQKLKAEHS